MRWFDRDVSVRVAGLCVIVCVVGRIVNVQAVRGYCWRIDDTQLIVGCTSNIVRENAVEGSRGYLAHQRNRLCICWCEWDRSCCTSVCRTLGTCSVAIAGTVCRLNYTSLSAAAANLAWLIGFSGLFNHSSHNNCFNWLYFKLRFSAFRRGNSRSS